ncbi:MAG TPA: hypothetical protein VFW95_09660 [Candidatus Limnocylindria bacterium]|nr:hypothetical protein [Candidatus Limnocylindria bacterium]
MTTKNPEIMDDVTAGTETAVSEPDALTGAGLEAGDRAGQLAERASDIGFQQADKVADQAANGVTQVADSIRRVSLEMQTEQPAISNLAETAAEQADRIASYLRENDARQMLNAVEDAARRQPLLFLGGAFVLGVAASRFLKAGGSQTRPVGYRSYSAIGPGARNGLEDYPSEGR